MDILNNNQMGMIEVRGTEIGTQGAPKDQISVFKPGTGEVFSAIIDPNQWEPFLALKETLGNAGIPEELTGYIGGYCREVCDVELTICKIKDFLDESVNIKADVLSRVKKAEVDVLEPSNRTLFFQNQDTLQNRMPNARSSDIKGSFDLNLPELQEDIVMVNQGEHKRARDNQVGSLQEPADKRTKFG